MQIQIRPFCVRCNLQLPLLDNLIHTRRTFVMCRRARVARWDGCWSADGLESVWSGGGRVVRDGIQSTNKSPEYSNEIAHHPCEGGRWVAAAARFLLGTDCRTGNGKCRSPLQRISILSDFPGRPSGTPLFMKNGAALGVRTEKGRRKWETEFSTRPPRNVGQNWHRSLSTVEASRRSAHSFSG